MDDDHVYRVCAVMYLSLYPPLFLSPSLPTSLSPPLPVQWLVIRLICRGEKWMPS